MMLLLRADGTEEYLEKEPTLGEIQAMLGASSLDVVSLSNLQAGPHTLYVDDLGYSKGLPPNKIATALYHTQCKPGTTWEILGDVVLLEVRDDQ